MNAENDIEIEGIGQKIEFTINDPDLYYPARVTVTLSEAIDLYRQLGELISNAISKKG